MTLNSRHENNQIETHNNHGETNPNNDQINGEFHDS